MNTPLNSNEQAKVLIFAILLLPWIFFFGAGLICIIFLLFGIYSAKKHKDFSNIEIAVRNTTIFIVLVALFIIILGVLFIVANKVYDWPFLIACAIFCSTAYIVMMIKMFYTPLLNHRKWVENHGIFASAHQIKAKEQQKNISKDENVTPYSVADELQKLSELKMKGHLTEQEYTEAKTKVLKR